MARVGEGRWPQGSTGRLESRLFSVVLLLGLAGLIAATLVVMQQPPPRREVADSPIPRVAAPAPVAVSAPVPTLAPTTSTTGPVVPPRDPYAEEPIQQIGTIEIPKIGLRHTLFNGITLRNIDQGPSHWPGTALPGQNGNVVIAGHRVTHTRPFRNIDQLVPGDLVHFDVAGIRTTYVVTGSEVVAPSALRIVDQTATPTGTLFACHPPGSARQRYVVHLALVAEPGA